MGLTSRQKTFCGLLCVAAAALGVDRAFFEGGPHKVSAAARHPTPAAVEASAAPAAAGTAAEAPTAIDRVAQHLQKPQYACANDTDAFLPSAVWRAAAHPVVAAAGPAAVDLSLSTFAASHKVSAILALRGGGGEAIVNGVTLRKGQQMDGFVMTDITPRRVRFACRGGAVDLVLAP